jgi:flagellar hook assembly protein FlgD
MYELVFSTGNSAVDAPVVEAVPTKFALSVPRPNPFGSSTAIELAVPAGQGKANVSVYDLQGRLIAGLADEAAPGRHLLTWDGRDSAGRNVAAGVYFVRLEGHGAKETRKITLLR